MLKKYIIPILLLFLLSCEKEDIQDLYNSAKQIKQSKIITYPFQGSVFPMDIISPTIRWTSQFENVEFTIRISNADTSIFFVYHTKKDYYRIPSKDWGKMKQFPNDTIKIELFAHTKKDKFKSLAYDKVKFIISSDKVDAPIFFRTVTLPFGYAVEHLETIKWRLGYVSDELKPFTVLENMPVCGNCHTFSIDGKIMGMDVDYGNDKGSYALFNIEKDVKLTKDKIITWSDYKKGDGEQTFGLLSAVSPNGRYAISTLKDRSVSVKIDNLEYSKLFFPIKGILVYYDRETKKFKPLKGADDKKFVNSNPTWSPDGDYLVFARSKSYKLPEIEKSKKAILPPELAQGFVDRKKLFKYDLYKVSFNEGLGEKAEPIPGASNNGKSNYFPKISPDGKWLIFTQAQSFMLLMPDSKLYLIPAEGGKPRKMNCNLSNMNSWHSWSPNGKWIVFASKHFGPYTQLYLAHIDENGNDSPPVLLEQFQFENLAANIPEFLNLNEPKFFKIKYEFLSTDYYGLKFGKNKIVQGDYQGAINELTEIIKLNPEDYDAYNMRAIAYSEQKKYDEAINDFAKCIEIKKIPEAYFNRGAAYFAKGNFQTALEDFTQCLRLSPDNIKALYKRAICYHNTENYQAALKDFNKYIANYSIDYRAYYERAQTKIMLGMRADACKDLQYAKENGIKEAQELIDETCK